MWAKGSRWLINAKCMGRQKSANDTFIGMQAVVIEPGAKVIGVHGVHIARGRYVPALTAVTRQADADRLPRL